MIRNILAVVFLLGAMSAFAQDKQDKALANLKPKSNNKEGIDYRELGSPMPKLYLITLDTLTKLYEGKDLKKVSKKMTKKIGYTPVTRVINEDDLTNTGNFIMMMFNPTCGHCEDQTEIFKMNMGLFKNTRLFLIAKMEMKSYLPDFVRNHKTSDFFPKMTVGLDSAKFVSETFMYGSLPQLMIYNNERKLIRSFNGEVPMDTLKQYIN